MGLKPHQLLASLILVCFWVHGWAQETDAFLTRTTLIVQDTNASLKFYRDLLGYEVVYEDAYEGTTFRQLFDISGDKSVYFVILKPRDKRGSMLGLLQIDGEEAASTNGTVLWMNTDNLDGLYERIRHSEPGAVNIVAQPFLTRGGREMLLADPDGTRVYVFQAHENPTKESVLENPLPRFVQWMTGGWDNVAQVNGERYAGVADDSRRPRYAMKYVPAKTANIAGTVFAIHNYGEDGFQGSLQRIALHRFSWLKKEQQILHQFLFVKDADRFGPFEKRLNLLANLNWEDVKTNESCNMRWNWVDNHFEGATTPGACITSSFTKTPIRVEGKGQLWPDRLLRWDRNFTLEGDEIKREGGDTQEVFFKKSVKETQ